VVTDRRHQAVRAAVRPTVLLPEPGHVVRVGGADRQPALGLAVGIVEVRARETALGRTAAAGRERRSDTDRLGGGDHQRRRTRRTCGHSHQERDCPECAEKFTHCPPPRTEPLGYPWPQATAMDQPKTTLEALAPLALR